MSRKNKKPKWVVTLRTPDTWRDAEYECCKCGKKWIGNQIDNVYCRSCGSDYVKWVNYDEWMSALHPDWMRWSALMISKNGKQELGPWRFMKQ